jgi:hypothetical protein
MFLPPPIETLEIPRVSTTSLAMDPKFLGALTPIKQQYAAYYANHALEDAAGCLTIYDPGEYEHGHLNSRGERIWDEAYVEHCGYFDETVGLFLGALDEAQARRLARPEDAAMQAISDRDTGMDLPALITIAWEQSRV